MFRVNAIDHVALAVSDVASSVRWYAATLGLERRFEEAWGEYPAVMAAGETSIALFPVEGAAQRPALGRDALIVRHVAFRVDSQGFQAAQEALTRKAIGYEFSDHEIAHSIYFQDPDGHRLEITTYDL